MRNRKRSSTRVLLVLAAATMAATLQSQALAQNPTRGCLSCHSDPTLSKKVEGKRVDLFIDPERYARGAHRDTECSSCHIDYILQSPHTKESPEKLLEAASLNCRECHEKLYNEYVNSLHGKALKTGEKAEGAKSAPSCAECHDPHYGMKYPKVMSAEEKMEITESCEDCHEEAFEEFTGNYHFRALKLDYEKSAGCTDCHPIHNLQKVEPNTDEAAEMCKDCHPKANANMAGFLIHTEPESPKAPLIMKIILIFMTCLTAGVLAIMYLHSLGWWIRKTIEINREKK